MTYFGGVCGDCLWAYFSNGISNEDWDRYLDFYAAQPATLSPVLLTMAMDSSSPSASQRKKIAGFIQANPAKIKAVRASAYVLESAVGRAALTAIGWIAPKPYPEKLFSDPREAVRWLATVSADFKAPAVIADIAGHLPFRPAWMR